MNTLPDFGGDSLHLFEVVPIALMLINAHDGAIIAVNSSALQLFDCGSVNVVGKTTIDLGIWVEPQERSRLMHLMAGVGQFKDQKVRMRTVGGQSLAARCRVPGVLVRTQICCFFLRAHILFWTRPRLWLRLGDWISKP